MIYIKIYCIIIRNSEKLGEKTTFPSEENTEVKDSALIQ